MPKGHIFVLSAPSGAGKTTLYKGIIKEIPKLKYSISHTTRPKRAGETNGRDYFFASVEKFKKLIKKKEFIEWAKVHDNYYGTSHSFIQKTINSGFDVVLDIDVQGALQMKKAYPGAVLIFIMAPSFKELKKRLVLRKKDSREVIKRRLCNAKKEVRYIKKYDYLIINDKVSQALRDLYSIITSRHLKVSGSVIKRFD
ncbi:MAG: guanylate kinase [Elusimicrobia bacterium]|nr:guanylate kinase [Candidatus Liberimonas magnetica]